MNIDLPADTVQFLDGLVASGQYRSADDAVVEGVRLLMTRQHLQVEIQKGIDELDSGKGIDGRQVFADLRDRAAQLAKQSG